MAHIGDISESDILLSICIPTYNRATILKKSLESLINQDIFIKSNSIEIVISDNCSTDETQSVVDEYVKKFGSKIKYSQTEFNILDKNIERVLSLGEGEFLKLSNDTLIHLDGSLEYYLKLIQACKLDKEVLFFSNGLLDINNEFRGSGIENFIHVVSYYSTWIASFGIWKSDFNLISNFGKSSHLHLIQLDNLLEMVHRKNEFIVSNVKIFDVQEPFKKGGFDIISVFLENYSFLLSKYLNNNLTKRTYDNEMEIIVKRFIINCIMLTIFYPEKYNYLYKNAFSKISAIFKHKPIFFIEFFGFTIFFFLKHLLKRTLILLKILN